MSDFRGAEMQAAEARDRLAAKDAEIARLTDALDQAEAVISIVEPRSDKAEYLRVLGVVRAALKGSPAPFVQTDLPMPKYEFQTPNYSSGGISSPDSAEAVRAKTLDECEAIAREASEEHDGFGAYEPNALRIAEAIAALKGKGEGNDYP